MPLARVLLVLLDAVGSVNEIDDEIELLVLALLVLEVGIDNDVVKIVETDDVAVVDLLVTMLDAVAEGTINVVLSELLEEASAFWKISMA